MLSCRSRVGLLLLGVLSPSLPARAEAPAAAPPPRPFLRKVIQLNDGQLAGALMGKVKGGIEDGVRMNLETAKARVEGK